MTSLKVGIADDHEVFRNGLAHVVRKLADEVEFVEAGDFDGAMKRFPAEPDLDLVLVDLYMPGVEVFKDLKALCSKMGDVPVVVVSMSERPEDVRRSIEFGARGYIPKTSSLAILTSAIKLVLSGGVYLPPNVLHRPGARATPGVQQGARFASLPMVAGLTRRQREVLDLVGQGKSNKDIAGELGLAAGTVKIHMTKIFKTLNVKNRMQAVIAASSLGGESGKRGERA